MAGVIGGFWAGWGTALVLQRDGYHDNPPTPTGYLGRDLGDVSESAGVDDPGAYAKSLMWSLRRLGEEYGPLGVALAASSLTDRKTLVDLINHGARVVQLRSTPYKWPKP